MPGTLPKFEGKAVTASEVRIMRAGDGLSQALRLAPVAYKHGTELTMVLRGRVSDIQHPEVKDDEECLRRVHRVDTMQVVILGDDQVEMVKDVLESNSEWLRKALQEEAGVSELFDGEGEEDITDLGDDEGGPGDPLRKVLGNE